MVGAETAFALAAIDHRVRERVFVSGIVQHLAVGQNRGVQAFNVVTLINHCAPPCGLDVVFELDAERAVIVYALQAAVYVRILKNKTSSFAQGNQLFHLGRCHFFTSPGI